MKKFVIIGFAAASLLGQYASAHAMDVRYAVNPSSQVTHVLGVAPSNETIANPTTVYGGVNAGGFRDSFGG